MSTSNLKCQVCDQDATMIVTGFGGGMFCAEHYIAPFVRASCPEVRVAEKVKERAVQGRQKYGVGMERTDLTRKEWLQHAQEEAMDLAVYLEKLIEMEGK